MGGILREIEKPISVGERHPLPGLHARKIAAVEDAVGLALGDEFKPGVRGDIGCREVGELRVENQIAGDGRHFGDPRLEAALVERPDLGGAWHRFLGGVKKHRGVGHGRERDRLMVDQVNQGAQRHETFALVDVHRTVASYLQHQGAVLLGERRGSVFPRAVEFALIGQKNQRNLRLEIERERVLRAARLEGRVDGHGALVMVGELLGDQCDDRAAHGIAFQHDAAWFAAEGGDVRPEVFQVGDGVADDHAVAAIARGGDHPAPIEKGAAGQVVGIEVGDQGRFHIAKSVGEKQHGAIPLSGPGDHEFRPLDFAGVELNARGGRSCRGAAAGTGTQEKCENKQQGAHFAAARRSRSLIARPGPPAGVSSACSRVQEPRSNRRSRAKSRRPASSTSPCALSQNTFFASPAQPGCWKQIQASLEPARATIAAVMRRWVRKGRRGL